MTDDGTARARPQQGRSRATVEKILRAANQEFAERGSAAVTTTQIAARAGVSVGALYRFFPDKHAIGLALGERYLADAAARFAPLVAAIDDLREMPDALRSIVAVAGDLALEHPGYYQLTREVAPGDSGSAGAVVRSAMVATFEDALVRLGARRQPAQLRRSITLVIETVRHTLATAPRAERERSAMIQELADMVATYAEHRLTPLEPGAHDAR